VSKSVRIHLRVDKRFLILAVKEEQLLLLAEILSHKAAGMRKVRDHISLHHQNQHLVLRVFQHVVVNKVHNDLTHALSVAWLQMWLDHFNMIEAVQELKGVEGGA